MSRLEKESKPFRDIELAKNIYQEGDQYNVGNPNAISDGDEKGKGIGSDGTIGSKTDIAQRKKLEAKNKYGFNNEYNIKSA